MALDSKPSVRALDPNLLQTKQQGKGVIAARRANITTAGLSITLPASVTSFVIRNDGATALRLSFNADLVSNYFTIIAGASSPLITVNDRVTIKLIVASGSTVAEAILWG
jgi:hypothetical protein